MRKANSFHTSRRNAISRALQLVFVHIVGNVTKVRGKYQIRISMRRFLAKIVSPSALLFHAVALYSSRSSNIIVRTRIQYLISIREKRTEKRQETLGFLGGIRKSQLPQSTHMLLIWNVVGVFAFFPSVGRVSSGDFHVRVLPGERCGEFFWQIQY